MSKLTHPMITNILQSGVFSGLEIDNLIDSMCNAIYKQSLTIPLVKTFDEDSDPKSHQKKFRGDAFEIFGEYVCRAFENDKRIGVRNGTMIPLDEDLGVDLLGESTMGDGPVAVQFKFKSNRNHVFTFRELSTWLASAAHLYGASGRNLVLITTGSQVNHNIRKVIPNIRVINRNHLKTLVDGNTGFYDGFLLALEKSRVDPLVRVNRTLYPDQLEAVKAIGDFLNA